MQCIAEDNEKDRPQFDELRQQAQHEQAEENQKQLTKAQKVAAKRARFQTFCQGISRACYGAQQGVMQSQHQNSMMQSNQLHSYTASPNFMGGYNIRQNY